MAERGAIGNEVETLYTNGPAGGGGATNRPARCSPSRRPSCRATGSCRVDIEVVDMKLRELAHSRTGDKGTSSTSRSSRSTSATTRAVRARHGRARRGGVRRHRRAARSCATSAAIGALNFVLHGALGGGVTRTLALDAHGKSLGSALLEMEIPDEPVHTADRALGSALRRLMLAAAPSRRCRPRRVRAGRRGWRSSRANAGAERSAGRRRRTIRDHPRPDPRRGRSRRPKQRDHPGPRARAAQRARPRGIRRDVRAREAGRSEQGVRRARLHRRQSRQRRRPRRAPRATSRSSAAGRATSCPPPANQTITVPVAQERRRIADHRSRHRALHERAGRHEHGDAAAELDGQRPPAVSAGDARSAERDADDVARAESPGRREGRRRRRAPRRRGPLPTAGRCRFPARPTRRGSASEGRLRSRPALRARLHGEGSARARRRPRGDARHRLVLPPRDGRLRRHAEPGRGPRSRTRSRSAIRSPATSSRR